MFIHSWSMNEVTTASWTESSVDLELTSTYILQWLPSLVTTYKFLSFICAICKAELSGVLNLVKLLSQQKQLGVNELTRLPTLQELSFYSSASSPEGIMNKWIVFLLEALTSTFGSDLSRDKEVISASFLPRYTSLSSKPQELF